MKPGVTDKLAATAGIPGGLIEVFGVRLRMVFTGRPDASDLATMSDSELADMGISRTDTGRLFDPKFAREFEERGAPGAAPGSSDRRRSARLMATADGATLRCEHARPSA